jgi:hypothetical protein
MGIGVTGFPHTVFAARYAPVHEVRVLSMSGNRLRGLAAPDGGQLPSAVILSAGERTLSVSIATAFSGIAKAEGMRDGWCGFELSGLQQALAYGPCGEIRCAVTNRSLITLDDEAIASAASLASPGITIESLRDEIRRDSGTDDLDGVWPFAEAFFQEKGPRAFIDASYLYILGRSGDPGGLSSFENAVKSGAALRQVWHAMAGSEEFKEKGSKIFLGPFDPGFPFSVSPLGSRPSKNIA